MSWDSEGSIWLKVEHYSAMGALIKKPFGELSWENFERLCYRLAGKAERVEHVARYGRSGQAQQSIDLYARMANGKYEVTRSD
jgi:hypothetical protein